MARTLTLTLLLALLLALPAQAQRQGRIVGGTPSAEGAHPYFARVIIDAVGADGDALCGGTLIAARWIVTAGHCTFRPDNDENPDNNPDATPADVHVYLGKNSQSAYDSDPTSPLDVDLVIRHPLYEVLPDGAVRNDVGLLRLTNPVTFEQARLPRPGDGTVAPAAEVLAVGFGATDPNLQDSSDQLLEVTLPLVTDATCAQIWQGDFFAEDMLCAGGTYAKDTCQGDSGGPLLLDRAVVGVTSFGAGCADPNPQPGDPLPVPGIYARVYDNPLNDFIRAHVPQAEFDVSPSPPTDPGPITLSAVPTGPPGFSYDPDGFSWDLNGDGAFGDATGTTASTTLPVGTTTIALRATKASSGDAEIRRRTFTVIHHSPVGFAAPEVRVTEGQVATLGLVKPGEGEGSISATNVAGTAIAGVDYSPALAVPLSFAAGETSKALTLQTLQDTVDEPDETLRVDLTGPTGGLLLGTPASINVVIVDDDAPPPPPIKFAVVSAKRSGSSKVKVRLRVPGPGKLDVGLLGRGRGYRGRVLGERRQSVKASGAVTVTVKLTGRARSLLKRKRKLSLRVQAFFDPPGRSDDDLVRALKSVTIKRR